LEKVSTFRSLANKKVLSGNQDSINKKEHSNLVNSQTNKTKPYNNSNINLNIFDTSHNEPKPYKTNYGLTRGYYNPLSRFSSNKSS
jgi:hypothetical protein